MNSIAINTQIRNGKMIFTICAFLLTLSVCIAFLSDLISEFSWWSLALLVIFAFAVFGYAADLYEAFRYKDIKVVAEMTDDDTVKFYNTASNGKVWNESTHQLSNISRIYILNKKKNRGLVTDKYLEYKCINYKIDPTTTIEILPELFDAKDEDIHQIFTFLKENKSELELGYAGFLDTFKK